jgi:hypothetical protein
LLDSINNEKMTYARKMLSGQKLARDDIPCSTCEIYIAMRSRSKFVVRDSFHDSQVPHGVVDHSTGQHVIGAIHTNTIEGFWSIFKRGIVGSFHKVSRKYLPLYVAEFQFRYNNRMNPDIFGTAIGGC